MASIVVDYSQYYGRTNQPPPKNGHYTFDIGGIAWDTSSSFKEACVKAQQRARALGVFTVKLTEASNA